jgi:tRNA A-37 threonylcarbamoyl transferase component Bud32
LLSIILLILDGKNQLFNKLERDHLMSVHIGVPTSSPFSLSPLFFSKPHPSNAKCIPLQVSGVLFECLSRYSLIRPIGKGAYGTVCSADDLITNERVAIKKIGNVFDSPLDARRTLREIRLLCRLQHENIVGLRDVFPPPAASAGNFQDIYMVYDLLDTDLHQIIRSPQLLSPDHVKFMAYQLIRGLAFLHSAGVMHRDLKPSNVLLNANCDLKICDFGLVSS